MNPVPRRLAAALACAACHAFAADPEATLSDVKVTAHKRQQESFDVAGVSARTGAALERAGVEATDQLDAVFPELAAMGRSSRIYNNLTVRGISSADFYGPAVALYVDGVPQLPHAYAQSLLDVERIELLKGPQGAIYGRGALGGVINVESRRPGDKASGWMNAQFHGNGHRLTAGADSGFNAQGWAIQASLTDQRDGGSLDDPGRGMGDVDDRATAGGRLALHYLAPDMPLELRLRAGSERYRSHEEYYVPFSPLSRGAVLPVVTRPWLERKVDDAALDLRYELDEHWTLSGVLARQEVDLERTIGSYGMDTPEQQQSDFAELRLAYRGAGIDALFGLSTQRLGFGRQVGSFAYGPYVMGAARSDNDIEHRAVFADGAWRFAERWELGAGLRWASERARVDMERSGGTPGTDVAYENDKRFTAFTPRLALAYLPDAQQRFFAGVGRGFKPGGFNKAASGTADSIPYDSETSTSVEAGWKWRSADARQRAEITLYRIDSAKVQGWVGPLGMQTLSNLGDGRSQGVEFQWTAILAERHEVSLAGMANDSRYRGGPHDGKRVGYAPRHSLSLTWNARLGEDGRWRPGASLRRVGAHYFDPDNSLRQQAYTVADAQLMREVARDTEIGVYGRNLADSEYRVYADAIGAQLGAGREVGVKLTSRF